VPSPDLPPPSDPRVFFAAERTLLAWLRTGITVMALGFVIARFGLFLRLVALQAQALSPNPHGGLSGVLGIFFVVAGAVVSLAATIQHRRFIATLPPQDVPAAYSSAFAVAFGVFMAALGCALAAYLVVSEP